MFTGIIQEIGTIKSIRRESLSVRIEIEAHEVLHDIKVGDSIATNGVCLTVCQFTSHSFSAEAMPETLRLTNLSLLKPNDKVNLERALRLGDRLDGHIVSGHVDAMGTIRDIRQQGHSKIFEIQAPISVLNRMVEKGSVAIDGISLTITNVDVTSFSVALITLTQDKTTLSKRKIGECVNLENDLFAKYIQRFMQKEQNSDITLDFLTKNGF